MLSLKSLLILFASLFTLAAVILLAMLIVRLRANLQYVNMELGRCAEKEKAFWKKEKRLLLLAFFFPFL